MSYKPPMAELGTPENPEIIEPGQSPREHKREVISRWAIAFQILRVITVVSLPALAIDMFFVWTFQSAVDGGALPWLGLILLSLPALIFTFIAVAANLILWPALILMILGRAVANPLNDSRFARFKVMTNVRR